MNSNREGAIANARNNINNELVRAEEKLRSLKTSEKILNLDSRLKKQWVRKNVRDKINDDVGSLLDNHSHLCGDLIHMLKDMEKKFKALQRNNNRTRRRSRGNGNNNENNGNGNNNVNNNNNPNGMNPLVINGNNGNNRGNDPTNPN